MPLCLYVSQKCYLCNINITITLMKTKKLFLLLCLAAGMTTATAQETIGVNTGDITSPKLNADGTATFFILAPDAQKVEIEGDFTPVKKIQTPIGEMEQPGRVTMGRQGCVELDIGSADV